MANLLANLPPVPPSLKSIAPYLQRAEELRKQDPVIAYWCAYYAAQIGINLKTRDAASRDLLLALLGALEETKTEIGPNDAIHIESASSAYVENFALKVFTNADNEDRSAHITRSTAKKFLAAANFLEVLKTFPKSDISESNEEKIRYAKWKATDIAKAFREGRKPAPGPPGWAEEQEELKRLRQEQLEQEQEEQHMLSAPPLLPSDSEFHLASNSTIAAVALSYAPRDEPSFPSSNTDFSVPTSSRPPNDPRHPKRVETGDYASEPWSIAATSGVSAPLRNLDLKDENLGWGQITSNNWSDNTTESDGGEERRTKARSRSGSSSGIIESPSQRTVSQEVEGQYNPISSMNTLTAPNKSHFSPSTVNPQPPQPPPQPYFASATEYHRSLTTHTSPDPSAFFSSAPQVYKAVTQESPSAVYSRFEAPPPPSVPVQEDPVDLTPGIIAKAQKHCRFAVSALNYDDVEQAKKELRAALALLGG